MTTMKKAELRAAADLLRAILARVEAGELTAPRRVVARSEDAATAFEEVAQPGGERDVPCDFELVRAVGRHCPQVVGGLLPKGRVVLGGCIVYGDARDPRWACRRCANERR